MTPKPSRSFSTFFALVTLTDMISETINLHWLHYASKPLIMGLLLLFARSHTRRAGTSAIKRWLLTGMFFAWLGDIFLMIREVDLFALGLGFFLLMQLCYCRVFWLCLRQEGKTLSIQYLWKTGSLFVIYDAVFLVLLHPVLTGSPAFHSLWWPVVVYTACLSTMGFLATQTSALRWHDLRSQGSISIGALLFILSDSAIALNKFLYSIPGSTWVVMSTYAAAQYLIVVELMHRLEQQRTKSGISE